MYRKAVMSILKNFKNLKTPSVINNFRAVHCGFCLTSPRQIASDKPSPAIARKYQILNEENATIIENTAEEVYEEQYPVIHDEFEGINLERGKTGVFEIEDLVDLLRRENSVNIFVATVPKKIKYVDYICVASGKSKRHTSALAEFVRKVYKKKCHYRDRLPRIEGKDSDQWMALDLGNIALHIFTEKVRIIYDLETLWSVGPEYDEQMHKTSDVVEMFENYSSYLKDLKPLP